MLHGVRSTPRSPAPHEYTTEKRNAHPLFTTPEHRHLGNHITLTWPDPLSGTISLSATSPHAIFHLQDLDPSLNPLHLSYGTITSLAGDFYGTYQSICDGPTLEDRIARFTASWNLLTREFPSVAELERINRIEHALELDPLHNADPSDPPSKIYASMSDILLTHAWFRATNARDPAHGYSQTYPGYLGLLLTNWDHFGASAHTAYIAGHTAALRIAASSSGRPSDLKLAYALNAFADHFLEDAFSAGHLRTPRRALHDAGMDVTQSSGVVGTLAENIFHLPVADLCANLMHDEDSALGLDVENAEGDRWTCFGDDYLFDPCGADTLRLCVQAMQRSADEVFTAFTTREVRKAEDFGALKLVPSVESANREKSQRLAPLFKVDEQGRVWRRGSDLQKRTWGGVPVPGAWVVDRTDWSDYTCDFWYATTWVQCKGSGRWEWPMSIEEGLEVGKGVGGGGDGGKGKGGDA